jgi:glutaminyl-tRNA synthetase
MKESREASSNFLATIINTDLESGKHDVVVTRFPPEPNGYLHIGHAKSISVNFGLAEQFGGRCNLRFDDTNPEKENQVYIDAIQDDVRWLGYQWNDEVLYASSYFHQLYEWAKWLINQGMAYVCDLSADEAREYRGTLTEPGRNSPYRERTTEENLALLEGMKAGKFDEGSRVLRARIDMASPNINMRDPILYRIRKLHHHQTGNEWCIYPTYDFAHGQEDAIEGITHSICTLEFEDHRPLYEWFLDNLPVPSRPRQYEFARLNVNYTITSKRRLKQLVESGTVSGWDDPRMPTISGMRRRGYTPGSIRTFCDMVGTNRSDGIVDVAMLEHCIRDDLDENAPRAMCVLNPLRLIITNIAEGHVEQVSAPIHPNREEMGQRSLPFSGELLIDRDDFREEANKKFKRLVLGKRVRLRNAYVIEADEVERDDNGEIAAVKCRLIENSLGQDPADGVKPKGVIHWVSAAQASRVEIRLYDRLFNHPAPDRTDEDMMVHINPDSLVTIDEAWLEGGLENVMPETVFQFEREGYFVADRYEYNAERRVFNRVIGLRDSWGEGK